MNSQLKDMVYADLEEKYGEQSKIVVINLEDFLSLDLPPRELILSPWLPKSGLCMLHAFRGVGKTHLSLGIAYTVAIGGTFLSWKAEKPRGVLYIDGEMPAVALQERLTNIVLMNDGNKIPNTLRIITPDLQTNGIPDISTPEGQEVIDRHIDDSTDLIILGRVIN